MTHKIPNSNHPIIIFSKISISEDDCACAEWVSNTEQQALTDNDCACVEALSPFSPPVQAILYQQTPETLTLDMPNDFVLALGIRSPNGPVVLNRAAHTVLRQFAQPKAVHTPTELALAQAGLLCPAQETEAPSYSIQALTAWLHITNACDLTCPYCYVRKSSATLPLEVGQHAIEGLFHTARLRKIPQMKLKYAGGEATLHFDLVRALHAHAQMIAAREQIELHAVVLSNGLHLGLSEARWLVENRVNLMISLDGVGAAHDQMRSSASGEGTFHKIERCMDEILLPQGLLPTISITVTSQNAAGVADTVRWALARKLPVSLNFYRQPDNTPAHADLKYEETQIIAGMQAAYQVFEEYLPDQPFFNGLLDRFRVGAHQAPCGVGRGYVVITHEGKLAECHMKLEDALPGDLDRDLLEQLRPGTIQNLAVEDKSGCQKCFYRYYCAGGCPLETYRARARWDAPGPNCAIYRALAPSALRLEGLRLLKANGYL